MHLVHEDLLDTTAIVIGYVTGEDLLAFSCVFQALVVVVDEQDQFVLIVHDAVLVINHLDGLQLL